MVLVTHLAHHGGSGAQSGRLDALVGPLPSEADEEPRAVDGFAGFRQPWRLAVGGGGGKSNRADEHRRQFAFGSSHWRRFRLLKRTNFLCEQITCASIKTNEQMHSYQSCLPTT